MFLQVVGASQQSLSHLMGIAADPVLDGRLVPLWPESPIVEWPPPYRLSADEAVALTDHGLAPRGLQDQ